MPSVSQRYGTGSGRFSWPSESRDNARRAPVVLMVSGGADSTALLMLAINDTLNIDDGRGDARIARERLHVLHVNHCLRGIDADEDEEFVRDLAARYGVPCTVERIDVAKAAERTHSNVENIAREIRYELANKLANELSERLGTPRSAARILTAHTADDRAETFFMNAIKGSGPAGLSSIPRRRNRIVRPLLDKTHRKLCDYVRMQGVIWREDATNVDTHYLRAFVRHEFLPLAKERNRRVVEGISSTCDILSDEDAYLTQLAMRAYRELESRKTTGMLALDARKLASLELVLARRVVRHALVSLVPEIRLEARHIASVLGIVAAQAGSLTLPMGLDVRVSHGMLFLTSREAAGEILPQWIEVEGSSVISRDQLLVSQLKPVPKGADPIQLAREHAQRRGLNSILLDAIACGLNEGGGKLWVDSAQAGDVMCPLGMRGQSKNLSDLLHDAQVPLTQRKLVPIVRQSCAGAIVWAAGIRADDRAACRADTRLFVELTLEQRDNPELW
ncbi:MAG: tRNA lysidine(34) synthetase TilS [Atopobiaceae bacterium]|nr:tRNA lysidine(34) synthetase TilS [Atopobiaceae bacterium]